MNNKIIEDLLELGIFSSKSLTEKEYVEQTQGEKQDGVFYSSGNTDIGGGITTKWFKRINTNGLSNEEIKLLLEIDRTKNIRSIKKMAIFFVVLTLISIVIAIWSSASIASML